MLAGPAQALAAHSISPIIPILSNLVSISTDSTGRRGWEQLSRALVANWLRIFSPMLLTARDLQSGDFDFVCVCFIFWFEWFTKVLQEMAGEVPKIIC